MKSSVARGALTALAVAGGLVTFVPNAARASLIFDSLLSNTGTGFGNTNFLLTLQECQGNNCATPSDGVETGGFVVAMGTPNSLQLDNSTGDVANQTQIRTLQELMVTDAASFRLIFDANEPGQVSQNSITLNKIDVTFLNPTTGASLTIHCSTDPTLGCPLTLNPTNSGTGINDAVFKLDATEVIEVQNFFAANPPASAIQVGVFAQLANAQGGGDAFGATGVFGAVPEPATLVLLGSTLLAGGLLRRRRSR